ncbi:MAG: NADPH:quinone oxidoreductase family protein [Alphaproteobacteria bacterium]|nr:MAG: NADPH:quinone oxidoreductase family protein [Alphaproteobacteria bacterium]
MKALLCERLSSYLTDLTVKDLTLPPPGEGEVRLRMLAASVNFPDVLMVQGLYQAKPPLPFTPGMEGVGRVLALGPGVDNVAVGDRVIAGTGIGAFAEEANVAADRLRPAPERLSDAEAAALTAAYHTAYVALHFRGDLKEGETLLVHGAAGGVGMAAVEVGKLMGATVIAAASTREKRDAVQKAGADHVLSSEPGFYKKVRDLTEGRGADVIYDPVGGDVFDECVRCIAFGGRLLVVGFASGRIPQIPVNMPLIKGFSVVGVRAGEFRRRIPELGQQSVEQIDAWVDEGLLTPHVSAVFPLVEAPKAMALLKDRKAIGKVVVTMTD